MPSKILLAVADVNQSDLIEKELTDAFASSGDSLDIDTFKNKTEALVALKIKPYDLIITHLHIAEDSGSTLVENEQLGLQLLRQAKEQHRHVSGILISPFINKDLREATKLLQRCWIALDGIDEVMELTIQALKPAETEKIKKVNLDFFVDLDRDKWEMISRGVGILCDEDPRVLSVDTKKIRRLLKANKRIEKLKKDWPDWEEEWQLVGEILLDQIFVNNPDVHTYFSELKGQVGGNENFSIRFNVGKEINPLILEALMEPGYEKDDEYWMLKAPICRRIKVSEIKCLPLFEDEDSRSGKHRINCLILEANVSGYIEKIDKDLERLDNVPIETQSLKKALESNQEAFKIGEIEHVPQAECSEERVKELLNGDVRWDLVHYAGHSLYDDSKDSGYVFFPNQDETKAVSIGRFSMWLRKAQTRFIYMSSCRSSNEDFVYTLTKSGIPATVGYRWDIDDDRAADHSRFFYKNLFEERSLENAFLRTRQDLREEFKEHIIWAAPVLVMQIRN
jgi:hypothetical protein